MLEEIKEYVDSKAKQVINIPDYQKEIQVPVMRDYIEVMECGIPGITIKHYCATNRMPDMEELTPAEIAELDCVFLSKKEAEEWICKDIKSFFKEEGMDSYRSLAWRAYPVVIKENSFDLGKALYFGFARFSVTDDKADGKHTHD